jgi:hypothetical protein
MSPQNIDPNARYQQTTQRILTEFEQAVARSRRHIATLVALQALDIQLDSDLWHGFLTDEEASRFHDWCLFGGTL